MSKTRKLLILGLAPLMMACGGSSEEEGTDEEEVTEETCTYSYDAESTVLTWTAFKLTEKIGVDGTFDQINVTAAESEDMFGVLTGATFEIPISSLNSQDATRDTKVKNSFFGVLGTEAIMGKINSIDATTANVSINFNGFDIAYDGTVSVEGETITMKTTIDITDYDDGQTAIDSLGAVCSEKHTGPDGVNKLWSDVDIAVKTTLVKTCK
ncbi:MAG: YceI family protein [Crocinitomicaceae bacterium]